MQGVRNWWSQAKCFLTNKKYVGNDKFGNFYYMKGDRRLVEMKGDFEPNKIPVQWFSWLNQSREQPPTPEELQKFELKQEILKKKVKELEEKEQKNLLHFGM
jgi:NADH:ubiquinone oxidoreductase subunit